MRRRRRLAALLLVLAGLVAACGGSTGSASTTGPSTGMLPVRTLPDLSAFLRLPPASPSACPTTQNGTTVGRSSPWVGHVDVSVYLSPHATPAQVRRLGGGLRHDRLVDRVYFESRAKAFQEFQRLYTCWAGVARSQTPASYRVVLVRAVTLGQRNALVGRLSGRPGVDAVSCDPSVPCVAAAGPTQTQPQTP